MSLTLETQQLSKKYGQNVVIKKLNLTFEGNNRYAILGHNGTGKSTLLKLLCGYLIPSKGSVLVSRNGEQPSAPHESIELFSYCSPHMTFYNEFSFLEMVSWIKKFRSFEIGDEKWEDILEWPKKQISKKTFSEYSSGMQQKAKLAIAMNLEHQILLLDEPLTNLDAQNAAWYHQRLEKSLKEKMVLIATNRLKEECPNATHEINLSHYFLK